MNSLSFGQNQQIATDENVIYSRRIRSKVGACPYLAVSSIYIKNQKSFMIFFMLPDYSSSLSLLPFIPLRLIKRSILNQGKPVERTAHASCYRCGVYFHVGKAKIFLFICSKKKFLTKLASVLVPQND
ncbi:hypothetical protein D9981_18390 [Pseudoalteromonas phenolica O-BC30]|nr:hypothetical protein D9981_18390 [Pseudoalteromonas phenolica O-BC30]